jgi:hypothetical protein
VRGRPAMQGGCDMQGEGREGEGKACHARSGEGLTCKVRGGPDMQCGGTADEEKACHARWFWRKVGKALAWP